MSQPGRDSGFTLIELLVSLALLSIVMVVAVGGWASWSKAREHSGSATELESRLRQAQQQAVTEGQAMCLKFSADEYAVFRGECVATGARVVGPFATDAKDVHLTSPSFTNRSGTPEANVTFYPRGTASEGTVKVTRTGTQRVYTVTVEGLTGRVSLN